MLEKTSLMSKFKNFVFKPSFLLQRKPLNIWIGKIWFINYAYKLKKFKEKLFLLSLRTKKLCF